MLEFFYLNGDIYVQGPPSEPHFPWDKEREINYLVSCPYSLYFSEVRPMKLKKSTRPPAVAGMFYPGETSALQDQINGYLKEGNQEETIIPKALIVPHAGTIYSGSIAGSGYRRLLQYRHVIRKVILLGPAHRVHLKGLALPTVDRFQSPLGNIDLDTKIISQLVEEFPQVSYSEIAHAEEHSLEVQLPFLQSILSSFRLVPLVVGDASAIEVAEVIEHLWGGDESLLLISSDLSHFHTYDKAVRVDKKTAGLIEAFKGDELPSQSACGLVPLRGLLRLARQKKMTIQRFDLRNSGDTAGPRDQVVGYGCWGLYENQ